MRRDSRWADGQELMPGVWQFTTGYIVNGKSVIFERQCGYRSQAQSEKAMGKSYQKIAKIFPDNLDMSFVLPIEIQIQADQKEKY